MIKKLYFVTLALLATIFVGCSDEDTISNEKNGPKPSMDLLVSPSGGLNYGDNVSITGLMEDERNLEHYEIILTNSNGDTLATKYQMLLGQSFNVDDKIQIPLPKNATTDNLSVEVKLGNTRNGEESESFDLPSVGTPDFDILHLILSNGQVIDLEKNGDVFQTVSENVYPANIKGIISTTTSKNGLYWGTKNGEIQSMAKDSILIGGDYEASYSVSFNPITFEMTTGEKHVWKPVDAADCYYILGTISGHWQDGEITTERAKMKMNGFESGEDKYYTWTAPDGEDPEVGMWGSTAAGEFRLKKGNTGEYILWDGNNIVQSTTDDASKSFPVTAAGAFTIKATFENGVCKSIAINGSGKSLEFSNGLVTVNGLPASNTVNFSGSNLSLQPGSNYVYEGTIALTQNQVLNSDFDLSGFSANVDLFNGGGNSTWTLKAHSDNYLIRMDVFSGAFYACPTSGYPLCLYLDGWSIGPDESSSITWEPSKQIPLIKTTSGTYEATFYNYGWGGDVAFYVKYASENPTRLPITNFNSSYTNSANGDTSFKIPSGAGYFKVIIDLKDGINIGSDGTVTPKSSAKFTLDYKSL